MGARIPRHGDYTLPEHADIPQWLIDDERLHARKELRSALARCGADPDIASRLAFRVVPDRSTYTRLEREHRALRCSGTNTRGDAMPDCDLEAEAHRFQQVRSDDRGYDLPDETWSPYYHGPRLAGDVDGL